MSADQRCSACLVEGLLAHVPGCNTEASLLLLCNSVLECWLSVRTFRGKGQC